MDLSFMDKVNFGNIKDAIAWFSNLIKEFTAMLKAFVESWAKVPAAVTDGYEYKTPTNA